MKLQQLRYIWEVAHHNLNVSNTAQSLYTSQPGISKQIRLLEDELGIQVFMRSGKHLTSVTPAGQAILEIVGDILNKVDSIKHTACEYKDESRGQLSIGITSSCVRNHIPMVLHSFGEAYPEVVLSIKECEPSKLTEMILNGALDLALMPVEARQDISLVCLPFKQCEQVIIAAEDHPIRAATLTLRALTRYPLVGNAQASIASIFQAKGLKLGSVFEINGTAAIINYVRLGIGIGIVPVSELDQLKDEGLIIEDSAHLFKPLQIALCFKKDTYFRRYMVDFSTMVSPSITKDCIERSSNSHFPLSKSRSIKITQPIDS